ncbi:MAG: cation:proton antiporter [Deltaproteobacteria bacterium]|nr:cation:proton antiporter [Deltaproteobacteria bacterium]
MDAHAFLVVLAVVLGVAAVTTVVFQWLRQPVVLGYILAGLIVGPSVPVPLAADRQDVQALSELGVILVMFSLGLEFSLRKLFKLGPTAGLTALLETSLMLWLGFMVGRLLGWSTIDSVFTGAIVAISSTTIIAKAFEERRVQGPVRELVVGVLIVEDLIAILFMATLTAIATGTHLSAGEMAATTGRLALFLVGLMAIGMLLVPRTFRAIARLGRPETTLVASVGFCFAISLLAYEFGYSVALGAFIAGSLIAESGEGRSIAHLVQPLRDMFAAIFFVSVGMLIDPAIIIEHWGTVLAIAALVVGGKVVGVTVGAFLTGNTVRTSVQAGMTLAQIGEFSFIIAGLGLALGATGDLIYPVAVAVSAITTLTTPWLIAASGPVAERIDRHLPRRVRTFTALYGSWVEQLRAQPRQQTRAATIRRLVSRLLLDVALLAAILIGTSVGMDRMKSALERGLGVDGGLAHLAIVAVGIALVVPLSAGILRIARQLGLILAETALPGVADGVVDLAAAPRRALVVTLQLAIVLLTGLPLLALTQPFLGGVYGPIALVVLLVVLGFAFWRGAADLYGHVRAGAETILEVLLSQARSDDLPHPGAPLPAGPAPPPPPSLEVLHSVLPGLGTPTPVRLDERSPAVGRSLADLNLSGITGAAVLAIMRGDRGLLVPAPAEVLHAGDVLALAGTQDAVEAATRLLQTAPPALDTTPH